MDEEREEGCEDGIVWRGSKARRQQIGENAAAEHFFEDGLRGDGDGYRNGLALADFIFEDAQGLVERGYQEIDDALAHGLTESGGIGGGGERGGSGDVGGDRKCASRLRKVAC